MHSIYVKTMKKSFLLLTAIVFYSIHLLAQGNHAALIKDSFLYNELEQVVVTGQYQQQSAKNSVYQIRTISRAQIEKQGASKLQDVLARQMNIRFSQDPATGGSNITMLGLSGQNVKILIDGMPVVGRQGTSNEININQIDLNAIERIEVVEGPMSVVFGADALAGVVNIITRKTTSNQFSVNARMHEESAGKEYGWNQGMHNQYIGGNYNYKNWYASAGVGRNLFHGWKDTASARELIWHKKDQITAYGLLGYHNEKLDVNYRLDGLDEIITNPGNFIGTQPAADQDYLSKRLMHQLKANYTVNGRLNAGLQAAYTGYSRETTTFLIYPNGDKRKSVAPGAYSFTEFTGFTLRGNLVYRASEKLSLQPGFDINMETGKGERIKAGVQKINDYAFYITSEYKPLKSLNLRPGLRFISNSVYDAPPVIPSLNMKWSITHHLDLRLAYARGFRAPSIRELYFDFVDGSHDIIGNTNLEAEYSNSFTGSLSLVTVQKENLKKTITLSGFFNAIENMIGYIQMPDNPRVTTYGNINSYKTKGFSFNGSLRHKQLHAEAGWGLTGRFHQLNAGSSAIAEYKWSPEANLLLGYHFPKAALDINLYYKYTGKLPYYAMVHDGGMEDAELRESKGYHWADFTVNKKLLKNITINAGVKNLFDITSVENVVKGAGATTGYMSIATGRSWFAGISFEFSK